MTDRWLSIQLKMTKAKTLLSEVEILINHKGYNSIISRLYYACYHATSALLLTKGLQSKSHKGLSVVLNKEFVLKGYFDIEKSAFFARLMQERMDEDYGDFIVIDEEIINEFYEPSKEYIQYIEILVNENR